MSTTAKASEHIKPCNIAQSERHNKRDADYIASLNPAMLYIRRDLAHLNEVYVAPDMEGVRLQQHYDNIRIMVKQKTGRAMQEKDVEFTDKKGKERGDWQARCSLPCLPISTALTRVCSSASKPFRTLPILASEVVAASMVTYSGTTSHTLSNTT